MTWNRLACWRTLAVMIAVISLLPGGRGRAELITVTPNSISRNPPFNTPAVQGTVVAPGNVVFDQYIGLGVAFGERPFLNAGHTHQGLAIIDIGGVSAWAPTRYSSYTDTNVLQFGLSDGLHIGDSVFGYIVHPHTTDRTQTSVFSVEVIGRAPHTVQFAVADQYFHHYLAAEDTSDVGPHGGTLIKVAGRNIRYFYVYQPRGSSETSRPWGVAQIQLETILTPEPAGLTLAVVGTLGATVFAWRRRKRSRPGLGDQGRVPVG